MVAHILPADPTPPTLRMGSDGQNSTFSEHGHVAYQIKEDHECSNMVARRPPPDLGNGVSWSQFNISENRHVAY